MKNYSKIISILLVLSIICNIYMAVKNNQSLPAISEETVNELINENIELANDSETRETIRKRTQELLNAMYSNRQVEVQLKIDKMSPYLTSQMMEEYKNQTAYYTSVNNIDPNISTSVTNIIKPDSLKTIVEKQESEKEYYYSFSLFQLETTLPGEINRTLYSNMLCQFVWILDDEEWKVNKFVWNHAITSAYQKF